MKSAAIYVRVSTSRQAERDLSIPDQVTQCRAWCEQRGIEVVEVFSEPGASALDEDRPIFQEMIYKSKRPDRPFDGVVVAAGFADGASDDASGASGAASFQRLRAGQRELESLRRGAQRVRGRGAAVLRCLGGGARSEGARPLRGEGAGRRRGLALELPEASRRRMFLSFFFFFFSFCFFLLFADAAALVNSDMKRLARRRERRQRWR